MQDKRVLIDSNVWIYNIGKDGSEKHEIINRLFQRLIDSDYILVCSMQIINEVGNVLRKKKFSLDDIEKILGEMLFRCEIIPIDMDIVKKGIDIQRKYSISYYDSMVVSSSILSKCSMLYTEDMQDGLIIQGVKIENPFL